MANQFTSSRDWKREVQETCAKLQLCAILPDGLTANTKITTVCLHGTKSNCRVYSLINRQYCCKSSASKAHDPALKSKAAKIAWEKQRPLLLDRQKERWARHNEKQKHSQICADAIRDKREEGWFNPGWGRGVSQDDRNQDGILYLIRYLDGSGTHFKLGITKQKLSERFDNKSLVSIIQTWNFPLGKCFDLEQAALRYASQHGYRYASPTTTELIRPEGMVSILEFIEQSLDEDEHLAEFTIS
jgi:hypothetical protein